MARPCAKQLHSVASNVGSGAARYAGSRVLRVEDPRLLTGRGTFVDDVVRPGMLHACFVRGTIARARITGIDVTGMDFVIPNWGALSSGCPS